MQDFCIEKYIKPNEYFCRYGTRVDYIFCNENLRMDWKPVVVEHYEEDISDHKAVIATLIKKSGI